MTKKNRRLPAEWEIYSRVLLALPHADTDWAYILPEVLQTYRDIINAVTSEGMEVILVVPDGVEVEPHIAENTLVTIARIPTNDTWMRDAGPITCLEGDEAVALDFKFNGWGLKFAADHDNLINRHLDAMGLTGGRYENHLGFVLEGGSIESDGRGTILTTTECLLSPNRNGDLSEQEIESRLCEAFGAHRVLWLRNGYLAGDDTDSHVDTLARLVAEDAIAYVEAPGSDDEHHDALKAMEKEIKALRTADGRPYRLFPLPFPDPIEADGERLPATYANFLIMPTAVLLPTYGQPENDVRAIETLQRIYPERRIIPIDSNSLIKQHGSIHCVTMQLQ